MAIQNKYFMNINYKFTLVVSQGIFCDRLMFHFYFELTKHDGLYMEVLSKF